MSTRQDEVLAANKAYYDAFEALDYTKMAAIWSDRRRSRACILHGSYRRAGRSARELAAHFGATSAIRSRFTRCTVRRRRHSWVVLVEQIETRHGESASPPTPKRRISSSRAFGVAPRAPPLGAASDAGRAGPGEARKDDAELKQARSTASAGESGPDDRATASRGCSTRASGRLFAKSVTEDRIPLRGASSASPSPVLRAAARARARHRADGRFRRARAPRDRRRSSELRR